MTAKPKSAHYMAFHREMKKLAADAAAASAAAETAPPVACSIACQTEGGDPELLLPVACPTENSARDSASGEAGPPAKKANTVIRMLSSPWHGSGAPAGLGGRLRRRRSHTSGSNNNRRSSSRL